MSISFYLNGVDELKFTDICKSFSAKRDAKKDLTLINQYTRRELSEDEVYTFPVLLCDNEVDRDCEAFSVDSLHKLADLYKGKTGIFDHNPKGGNQTARVYDTEVVAPDSSEKNSFGDPYTALLAYCYIVRSEKNADLILELDAGIKKEVSVGCSVSKCTCSICGNEMYGEKCVHRKGQVYDGKTAIGILNEPTDAYEWSFVAIPSQRKAGVTKNYKGGEKTMFLNEDVQNKIQKCLNEITGTDKPKSVVLTQKADGTYDVQPEVTLLETVSLTKDFEKAFNDLGISIYTDEESKTEKSMVELALELSQKWASLTSEKEAMSQKAAQYDSIKSKAIESAKTAGVKAKGTSFDSDRWEKLFKDFSIEEIEAQAQEWTDEAAIRFNAGKRVSMPDEFTQKSAASADDYKL